MDASKELTRAVALLDATIFGIPRLDHGPAIEAIRALVDRIDNGGTFEAATREQLTNAIHALASLAIWTSDESKGG